jgi:hypothetical protein
MYWRILPHTTCCIASEQLILLDVRQDRYFMVPGPLADAAIMWLTEGPSESLPDALAAVLRSNGILHSGDPQPVTVPQQVAGVCRQLTDEDQSISVATGADCARVALLVATTRLRLKLQPLAKILGARHWHPRQAQPDCKAQAIDRARTFDAVRRFSPFPRNCLLDSLALDHWLARDRIDARLVFGVTAQPFAAHCWLQWGATILNDHYDRVSRFTPILAL